jgi:hypothetical protein
MYNVYENSHKEGRVYLGKCTTANKAEILKNYSNMEFEDTETSDKSLALLLPDDAALCALYGVKDASVLFSAKVVITCLVACPVLFLAQLLINQI